MRGGKAGSVRGLARSATANKNGNSGDRPEHPLSSMSRLAAEEAAAASGGGEALGAAAARVGGGTGGIGGGHRRMMSDMSSSQSDHGTDRRISHARDPLRRSGDTAASDTPNMAERGGHGRDGPVYPRELVAAGGNASRAGGGGAGVERERTTCTTSGTGFKMGEEELPMEVPGRYEKMRVLGRGSFGAVTLVKDHRDSKLYAMKTLNCADKLEERETAMAEVRLLKWLKHPCVLTLFDVFLSADSRLVCLTTTYCESGDLAKIVKHAAKTKSLLGEKTVLGWFAQLCLGVHNLHEEKRVLHRDIKPNNVFLMDSKKIIQLGDFGLAKVINDGDKQVKAEVGTPYYTSPEMCNNQPYGFPSDVWSLGIVLYELLSLDVPFRSRDVVALVSQVIKAPPPPLPEVYSDEVTALARWMLQKDPVRRPTLTQALACQPLRRHMSSFVKHYRPMNMAERQRRHDIKDLEAQVAAIIEQGGEDPQIPSDVSEGCGTHPTGAQDQAADSANRADSKSLSVEARGGAGGEEVEGAVAVVAVPGDPGGTGAADGGAAVAAAAAARAKTAERGAVRSPSTAGFASNGGGAIAVRTDGDDVAAGAGECPRCGARVPCACGGVRGGGGAGGATGGGGNTTPGRRFGSPQQSKGLRNVMSWAPGSSVSASATKDQGGGDGDDGGDRRSGRSSGHEEDATEWNPSSSGGTVGSVPSEESFSRSQKERRKSGGEEHCAAEGARDFRLSGDAGARKRSRDAGLRKSRGEDGRGSDSAIDQGTDSGGSKDSGATAPERPKSPRSPRSHSSTRLKRVSGGDSSSRGNGSIHGDDSEGKRTTLASALTKSNRDTSPRREGSEKGNRTADGEEEREGEGEHWHAQDQPSRIGDDAAHFSKPKPSTGLAKTSRLEAEDPAASSRQETSADNDPPTVPPTDSSRPEHGNADGPRRKSSAAAILNAAGWAGAALSSDHLAATPRTPRSPRLVDSGSETFKTAKRLTEALTFAASGSEGGPLTTAATSAASCVGLTRLTPRRESAALGGALAVVEEAADDANGTHRGVPLGGPQPADVRDAAAVGVPPSSVGSGGMS
eukprot:g6738.t1